MALLRNDEIEEMAKESLEEKLQDLQLELAKERAQVEIGGVPENPGKMNEIKNTVSRIKKELSER